MPGDGCVAVEEGVNSARLAASAALGYACDMPPEAAGPQVEQLSALQVSQQLLLYSSGIISTGAW